MKGILVKITVALLALGLFLVSFLAPVPALGAEPSLTPTPKPYKSVIPPAKEGNYYAKATKTAGNGSAIPVPKLDGRKDKVWSVCPETKLVNIAWGEKGAEVSYQALWNKGVLYLFITVMDDTADIESPIMTRKDSVELFFSLDDTKPSEYREGLDMHFQIGRDGTMQCGSGADSSLLRYAVENFGSSYQVEVAFTVPELITQNGMGIGFDIHVNDSFGTGLRDYIVTYSDTTLKTHTNLSRVGLLLFR